MEAWQVRVLEERAELLKKVIRLTAFISGNPKFGAQSEEAQTLLRRQRDAMLDYAEILTQRLALFQKSSEA